MKNLAIVVSILAGILAVDSAQACRPKPGDKRAIISCQQSNAGPDHGLEAIISRVYGQTDSSLEISVSSQSIAGPRVLFVEETLKSETESVTSFESENAALSFISDTPVKASIVLKKNSQNKVKMKCKHIPQPRC